MSLIINGGEPLAIQTGLKDPDAPYQCFYCYETIKDRGVMWMGSTASIYLHKGCFHKLFIRLARDVHQLECLDRQNLFTRPVLKQLKGQSNGRPA